MRDAMRELTEKEIDKVSGGALGSNEGEGLTTAWVAQGFPNYYESPFYTGGYNTYYTAGMQTGASPLPGHGTTTASTTPT